MRFKARLTRDAEADLDRLFDFLLERELNRDGGDLALPGLAIAALRSGIATLMASPFTCRKAGQSPFRREWLVPFGRSGCVALFEIEHESQVAILALRHQREDDGHGHGVLQRVCGQIADTVNQAATTVIRWLNKQVDSIHGVSIDLKRIA